jgi:hypothetical protein
MKPGTRDPRLAIFAVICAAAVALAVVYGLRAVRESSTRRSAGVEAPARAIPAVLDALRARPHVVFRSTASDDTAGRVVVAPLDAPERTRYTTSLFCDRVYMVEGQGICLAADESAFQTFTAYLFGADFRRGRAIPLTGPPSRARVSRSGARAATTVFETGHSYASTGFSTRTNLIDTRSGAILTDLEQFAVTRDGASFKAVDFNFWGVTFAADGNRFYATLDSGGTPYLVEGDAEARTAVVVAPYVECPSLSPDGTRVAFKRRAWGATGMRWQLHVMDLSTRQAKPVASEERSVDDQVEWLDDAHLLYGLPQEAGQGTNVWVVRADGTQAPRVFLSQAASPAVVR